MLKYRGTYVRIYICIYICCMYECFIYMCVCVSTLHVFIRQTHIVC